MRFFLFVFFLIIRITIVADKVGRVNDVDKIKLSENYDNCSAPKVLTNYLLHTSKCNNVTSNDIAYVEKNKRTMTFSYQWEDVKNKEMSKEYYDIVKREKKRRLQESFSSICSNAYDDADKILTNRSIFDTNIVDDVSFLDKVCYDYKNPNSVKGVDITSLKKEVTFSKVMFLLRFVNATKNEDTLQMNKYVLETLVENNDLLESLYELFERTTEDEDCLLCFNEEISFFEQCGFLKGTNDFLLKNNKDFLKYDFDKKDLKEKWLYTGEREQKRFTIFPRALIDKVVETISSFDRCNPIRALAQRVKWLKFLNTYHISSIFWYILILIIPFLVAIRSHLPVSLVNKISGNIPDYIKKIEFLKSWQFFFCLLTGCLSHFVSKFIPFLQEVPPLMFILGSICFCIKDSLKKILGFITKLIKLGSKKAATGNDSKTGLVDLGAGTETRQKFSLLSHLLRFIGPNDGGDNMGPFEGCLATTSLLLPLLTCMLIAFNAIGYLFFERHYINIRKYLCKKIYVENVQKIRRYLSNLKNIYLTIKNSVLYDIFKDKMKKCEEIFDTNEKLTKEQKLMLKDLFSNREIILEKKLAAFYAYFTLNKRMLIEPILEIGYIGTFINSAMLVKSGVFCIAEFVDGQNYIKMDEFIHPYLFDVGVKNNLFIGEAAGCNNIIFSGSNGTGKTTVMSMLIVNVALAQGLGIACCKKFVLTPYEKLVSIFGNKTNLVEGRSLYKEEIYSIKELVVYLRRNRKRRILVCLDEPLSSTNPEEADRILLFILLSILKRKKHTILIATHFSSPKRIEKVHPELKALNFRLSLDKSNNDVKNTYKLERGVGENLGTIIAKNEGLFDLLMDDDEIKLLGNDGFMLLENKILKK